MKKWGLAAALVTVTAAPTQAHVVKHHHSHAAAAHRDSVTLDGKDYKVCGKDIQDGCIQPREAGLGYGNQPTTVYRPDKADQHP